LARAPTLRKLSLPDVVDAPTRSRMMSGIRGKNTKPELLIRRALHRLGLRYRLHDKGLPGCPDLVFPKRRAVIFVHGCFWHGHDCHLFKWPGSRQEFWREKIEGNRKRDVAVVEKLRNQSWRVLSIWECALRGESAAFQESVAQRAAEWVRSENPLHTIRGNDRASH
jgi:DNA mismatch endonuclease (patch repair protein)